jgi:hypothetical protein
MKFLMRIYPWLIASCRPASLLFLCACGGGSDTHNAAAIPSITTLPAFDDSLPLASIAKRHQYVLASCKLKAPIPRFM